VRKTIDHLRSYHGRHKTAILNKIQWQHGLVVGMLSLFWLIVKTGRKPSRIHYPCQQTALANLSIFLIPSAALLCYHMVCMLKRCVGRRRLFRYGAVATLSLALGLTACLGLRVYKMHEAERYYQNLRTHGPFGTYTTAAFGAAAGTLLTIPHAMALPSPHRVVSVHDANATHWTFPCTGSGVCAEYYGDDAYVDQTVVDNMVATGLKALTDETSLSGAWQKILPDYQAGEIIAIKVNFNDSIMGGGSSGYADNDAYVDALPQIINSIVSGLAEMGVRQTDIWLYDASRYITDRFRARIAYEEIQYFDRHGNGASVQATTFDSTDPAATVDFSGTSYSGSHQVADILVEADYLINVPIMKRHGGAGITLALKNHLGSIDGFYSGGHTMHKYFYLNGSEYQSNINPIVNINNNLHIRDKTVLIVGDALYGGWRSNNTPPERWDSFSDDSPNMLFFAGDPVAIDSVMFDYLDREGYVNPASEDILIVAAEAGLGVHERWNNDSDGQYQTIDYIQIEGAGSEIPDPDPTEDPPTDPEEDLPTDPEPNEDNPTDFSNDSATSEGCFISCLR
jgi:hypothetical protein